MNTLRWPSVLIVDDVPDEQDLRIDELRKTVRARAVHPEEVSERMVTESDLILIDYVLERWPARETNGTVSRSPLDGLALAGILRGYTQTKPSSPTAIAIYSAHLGELSPELPPEPREHAIARTHNLEWVFAKTGSSQGVPLAVQIASLANAAKLLPKSWPMGNEVRVRRQVQELLALPDARWTERAWEELSNCYPPIHELSEWTHGIALVRWMLHRILPYPCFLLDNVYLAARLRLSPSSLIAETQKSGPVRRLFAAARYNGMLADFLGPRWWRAGVEASLWELTEGNSFDTKAIHATLKRKIGARLRGVSIEQPVVCLDENFQPMETLCSREAAVRLQPDDWPPYADQAWTKIELARTIPRLRALIVPQDRERISEKSPTKRRK